MIIKNNNKKDSENKKTEKNGGFLMVKKSDLEIDKKDNKNTVKIGGFLMAKKDKKKDDEKLSENDVEKGKKATQKKEEYFLNKIRIAKTLVRNLRLVYDPNTKEFYQYKETGGYWEQVQECFIQEEILTTLIVFTENKTITWNKLAEIWKFMRLVNILPKDRGFNDQKHLMNLKNGVYNLKTAELEDHQRNNYFSLQLPINYEPLAICERWEQFIEEVFKGDQELKLIAQEIFGYCLTTKVETQTAFFLYGAGGDGKSVFLKILEDLVGKHNTSNVPFDKLGEGFYTAQLHDKLINCGSEVEGRKYSETASFKAITTGDSIIAGHKNKPMFTFRPFVKLLNAGNSLPSVTDKSDGYFRRVLILPFLASFIGKEDRGLEQKLLAEIDGIFNWALAGLSRLSKNNWNFTKSQVSAQAKEDYKLSLDHLKFFLKEECTLSNNSRVGNKEFRKAYKEWCEDVGYKSYSPTRLTQELKRLKISLGHSGSRYFYVGVELAPEKT